MISLPNPILEALPNERAGLGLFRVTQDFAVDTPYGSFTVPAGYISDLASIPRPFRWLLPQAGHSAVAALVHDYLMHLQDKRSLKVFSYLLKAYGSGAIRHALMVTFVAPFTFLEWMGWEQKG